MLAGMCSSKWKRIGTRQDGLSTFSWRRLALTSDGFFRGPAQRAHAPPASLPGSLPCGRSSKPTQREHRPA